MSDPTKIKGSPTKIKGRITKPIKLKDQAEMFDLKALFGFLPNRVLVIKVAGTTKYYQLMAEYTPEEREKESRRSANNIENQSPSSETSDKPMTMVHTKPRKYSKRGQTSPLTIT